MPVIRCPECGAELPDQTAFCGKCGFALKKAADKAANFKPAIAIATAGFLFMAVLVTAISLIGVAASGEIDMNNDEMYRVHFQAINEANDIGRYATLLQSAVRTLPAAGGDSATAHLAEIREAGEAIDSSIARLSELSGFINLHSQEILAQIKKEHAICQKFVDEALLTLTAGTNDRAATATGPDFANAIDSAGAAANKLARHTREMAFMIDEIANYIWVHSTEVHNHYSYLIMILMTVGITAGVGMAVVVPININKTAKSK